MAGFFYRLGRSVGPTVRKGQWLWQSATGSEEEALAAEEQVGRDLANVTVVDLPPDPDPQLAALVDELTLELSGCVRNKHRTFRTVAVTEGPPNAFALPGGFLFVTRSLAELVAFDRGELAFVIAHEMAHVIRRHPIERVMTDAAIGAAVKALPTARVAGGWIKSTAGKLLHSAYSRDREIEADTLGFKLLDAAGFDAGAPSRMFARLAEISQQSENPLAEYFSTHPPFDVRIRNLRRLQREG